MKETRYLKIACIVLSALPASRGPGQEPLDLFQDLPELGAGFVRIGAWNLRHIDLDQDVGAAAFLPGANREEDMNLLVATFAKAVKDLALDLLAVVEHQPRVGEANRLQQLRDALNTGGGAWQSDETAIEYDDPSDPHGNLQLGLLWRADRVSIDPSADLLLQDLRQPRDAMGNLTRKEQRIPWLVPVTVGSLSFDLLVLHLKSGAVPPIEEEVEALRLFLTARLSQPSPRHLIVCGDWNLRPEQMEGRERLRKMRAPTVSGTLLRLLTVEQIRPTLSQWESLGTIPQSSPLNGVLPFSHFNPGGTLDNLLDHMAISRTLDEVFDHPIRLSLKDGRADLSPGISIPRPLLPEASFVKLTDHLPLVLILRTNAPAGPPPPPPGLSIAAALPNPAGDDTDHEEVTLRNMSTAVIPLDGWKLGNATSADFWLLEAADGVVAPGGTTRVVRRKRPMYLRNGGDTIRLIDPSGNLIDAESYGEAASGVVFAFP